MDGRKGLRAVVGGAHDGAEAVERKQDGRARVAVIVGLDGEELVAQGREDGPGLVGFAGGFDEGDERGALDDGVGEVLVGARGVRGVEDGSVGVLDAGHQPEGVDGLHPLLGIRVRDGGVFGAGCC